MGQFKIFNHTQKTESNFVCSGFEFDCLLNESFTVRAGDQLSLYYGQRRTPLPVGTKVHFIDNISKAELKVSPGTDLIGDGGYVNPWWSTSWIGGKYEIYAYDDYEKADTRIITLTVESAPPPTPPVPGAADAKIYIAVSGGGDVYIGDDIVTATTITRPIGGNLYVYAQAYPGSVFQKWIVTDPYERYAPSEYTRNPISFTVDRDIASLQAVFVGTAVPLPPTSPVPGTPPAPVPDETVDNTMTYILLAVAALGVLYFMTGRK